MKLPPLRSIPEESRDKMDPTFAWGVTASDGPWFMSFQVYEDVPTPLASVKVARRIDEFTATWIEVPWEFVYLVVNHILSNDGENRENWEIDWDLSQLNIYETIYLRRKP